MASNIGNTSLLRQNNKATENSGIIQQFMFPLIIVILLYLALLFAEIIYKYINRLSINRVELLPKTYIGQNKTITISQNPNKTEQSIIQLSENERTGIEFTYSFYINVDPSGFRDEKGLMHIFHKGYSSQFPLLAPGVYIHSNINTLRVYMNTFKTWNNFVDIENMPLNKWVHVAVICKNSALEIFINGNLSKKMSFDSFVAYQNYQDVVCFSQRRIALNHSQIPSTDVDGFQVFGSMKGMLSRLTNFNYALCYAEIQKEMNRGPSSEIDSSNMNDIPPYLADTWWSKSY
jgi:hypothetical protein